MEKSIITKTKWVKQVGDYYISDQFLGRGEFSEVYLGCFKKNISKKVACKIMKNALFESDPYVQETMDRQHNMLKDIDHENVVRFYDMMKTPANWYFFFEFCSLGTLESYILKKENKISESKALLIFMEICEGYKALYKLNIIHRDLKPANILMAESGVKISDFSFAKVLGHDQKNQLLMQSLVGTPVYTPLQILEGREYSSKCDVWSLGIMFYQMLCGRLPFIWKAIARNDLKGGIVQLAEEIRKTPLDYPRDLRISKSIKNLIEKMLQKDEKNRISWEDLFVLVEGLDFSDLSEVPQELKGFNPLVQKEIMEQSGLNKGTNMGRSVGVNLLHSYLKFSQKLIEENLKDYDIDESVGSIEIPAFRESKSIVKNLNK